MLSHFAVPTVTYWDELLVSAHFAVNNAWQGSIQKTPFFLNHGRDPGTHDCSFSQGGPRSASQDPASEAFAAQMLETTARAKRCMLNAQQRQLRYYDKKLVLCVFEQASYVLLATTHLHLKVAGICKLAPRCVGPFTVQAQLGKTSHRAHRPGCRSQTDNNFHVALIKPYRSDGRTRPPPSPGMVDSCPEWTVEQGVDRSIARRGRQKSKRVPHSLGRLWR